jgi:hypothetical protein
MIQVAKQNNNSKKNPQIYMPIQKLKTLSPIYLVELTKNGFKFEMEI